MAPPPTIFPKHIPGMCHPNVNSTISLMHDLNHEETSSSNEHRTTPALRNSEIENLELKSKSVQRIKEIATNCEPFLHKSNLYRIQLEKIKADSVRFDDESSYTKRKATELNALMKVFEMNYKYCVASELCPHRMNCLNRCFQRHQPELVTALLRVGKHGSICWKERRAVERCTARQVMNFANI